MSLKALDLFAGTGWGVACRWLGIDEVGVDNEPAVLRTREANGMATWLPDVWEVLESAPANSPEFRAALLIASPPCQTFSMAGKGAGRQALDEVVGLIDSRAYLDPARLREFGEQHDPRTALVLTPLTYVARHAPTYVVLEQVPTVLPVWERMAVELRRWGYSVVTGVLSAERYGVPQTRKRAILIARADGVEARMPTPTHSAYYSRNPSKLDEGVEPWVSMAEALGWGEGEVQTDNVTGSGYDGTGRVKYRRDTGAPAPTASTRVDRWLVMRSNYGTDAGGGTDPAALGGSGARRTVLAERPAGRWAAVPFQSKSWTEKYGERGRSMDRPAPTLRTGVGGEHGTPGFEWRPEALRSSQSVAGRERAERPIDVPALTGPAPEWLRHNAGAHSRPRGEDGRQIVRDEGGDYYQRFPTAGPAPTVTSGADAWAFDDAERDPETPGRWRVNDQSGGPRDADWPEKRPATTLATRDLVADPGQTANRHNGSTKSRNDGIRVTAAEAAALQSYPPEFQWVGNKTETFRQIGNAVPPLLAAHVLATILDDGSAD